MNRIVLTGILIYGFCASPSYAIIDDNHNGMSDVWERMYNRDNPGQLFPTDQDHDSIYGPNADPDGDGWTNLQESIAGTDPFDPSPPDGLVRLNVIQIPEFRSDVDGDGISDPITPAAIIITWPTIPGKLYTLCYSPDLAPGSWSPVEQAFIGDGTEEEFTFTLAENENHEQPPDKLFWRVMVEDVDSNNNDGHTLAENYQLAADIDGDGLTLAQEIALGTDPTNPDTDGDGMPDRVDPNPTTPDTVPLAAATTIMVWSPTE